MVPHEYSLFPAIADEQLWCLNGKKLRNAKGVWISASEWTLPDPETSGVVKDISKDKVLATSSTSDNVIFEDEAKDTVRND